MFLNIRSLTPKCREGVKPATLDQTTCSTLAVVMETTVDVFMSQGCFFLFFSFLIDGYKSCLVLILREKCSQADVSSPSADVAAGLLQVGDAFSGVFPPDDLLVRPSSLLLSLQRPTNPLYKTANSTSIPPPLPFFLSLPFSVLTLAML